MRRKHSTGGLSTGTRLILLLTFVVGLVMAIASLFVLRQREADLEAAMRDEVRAHALTLRIALEESYTAQHYQNAQRLIDRLRENTRLYSVILFDEAGQIQVASNSQAVDEIRQPPELRRVIVQGQAAEFVHRISGQEVFSVIMPIRVGEEIRGAFEIAEPLTFVQADVVRARRNFALVTLLLWAGVSAVVFLALRRYLTRPVKELLSGAAAIGHGELNHPVIVQQQHGEFVRLAQEFNRMADRLAEQRQRAAREAEERLQLERELRHSERLASVGRLAAGVAHELGAPLNVIDARAEQLLMRTGAGLEMRQRNLLIIRKQAARITHIVRQLLNLARPYNLHREPSDLVQLIKDTLDQIESSTAQRNVVVEPLGDCRISVDVDCDFIRQVLTNIFVNAVQAMPEGGRLKIKCAADAWTKDARSMCAVRISDTGTGIAPEHLAHIFDPFYTTKDVGSGTGLGLAVARRIIEEHGGWIEAINNREVQGAAQQAGSGATFTIYLPQCQPLNRKSLTSGTESVTQNEPSLAHR